jgi:hypothetical protein
METDKITLIKELNSTRKTLVESTFSDLHQINILLNKARLIAQKAPLRSMIKYDGTPFTNIEERQLFLNILGREINDLKFIKEDFYNSYKLQITITIVQIMISISDFGFPELEKILNQ